MNNESVKTFDKILEGSDYDHAKDFSSKGTKFIKIDFKKRLDKILKPLLVLPADENEDQSADLQGQGTKIIIPSNNINTWTRLKALLGFKCDIILDNLKELLFS